MRLKIYVFLLLSAIAAAGTWSGIKLYSSENQDPSTLKAEFLKGGDFQLKSGHSTFKLSSLKGRVVVLYFGYTHCPDVCPTGLSVIKAAVSQLGDTAANTQVIFVSLDPERDSAERLKEYLSFFDSRIIGLSGTQSELEVVAKQYGVYFRKAELSDSALGYAIDHSANFFVINKEGELSYVVDHSVSGQSLANTIKKLH